ncbi:hypothetical protein [Pontixanthobacter aquaemixtae]|uniref:Uncharacterized protein n=1 Tax=Pontixanthobacter aquaemixtae TaxID=1958940 RepID=A0A844ZRX3_9SPHN|nr:hypothetical protein [Pontixanthobacter aquaemixtae]MXO90613.1 hypothetical protein [Pontixanthobacter aquaemixtae]
MKTITKALAGTVAAGAMAMTSAAPAFARDRHDDGISAGDVIAGAVILGGIAAILSSGNNDRDRYRDRNYRYNDRYNYRYNNQYRTGERAVERCIQAAERDAQRAGYRYADVTQIRDVDRKRNGWRVKGRIAVEGQRGYRGYNDRYDRRGYRQHDTGKFTCEIQRGRIVDMDFSGVRGLR